MVDTYTKEQFLKSLKSRGIISQKEYREEYVRLNPKEAYEEDDFEKAYYWYNNERFRVNASKHKNASLYEYDRDAFFAAPN